MGVNVALIAQTIVFVADIIKPYSLESSMAHAFCSNPECRKPYDTQDVEADHEFCSFECWEKINCKIPPSVEFEKTDFFELTKG